MIPVGTDPWKGMQDVPLDGKVFDTGFHLGDLRTTDDVHQTLLRDPEARVTLVLWQDRTFPCLQIYTPRTLAARYQLPDLHLT